METVIVFINFALYYDFKQKKKTLPTLSFHHKPKEFWLWHVMTCWQPYIYAKTLIIFQAVLKKPLLTLITRRKWINRPTRIIPPSGVAGSFLIIFYSLKIFLSFLFYLFDKIPENSVKFE